MASEKDFGKPRGRKRGRGYPTPQHELAALKALVTIYGPREAARKAGLPEGTVTYIACQRKWKKAQGFIKPEMVPIGTPDAGDAIARAFAEHRENSQIQLAQYVDKASKDASKHKDPLDVARKVRDVAGVYQVLYPPESGTELIESSILIGNAVPTLNLEEIQASRLEGGREIIDVRAELPGPGPAGH